MRLTSTVSVLHLTVAVSDRIEQILYILKASQTETVAYGPSQTATLALGEYGAFFSITVPECRPNVGRKCSLVNTY